MFQQSFRDLIDEQCGGSQKKLSVDTGIATATINKWYNGVNEPNCKQLITLADYFKVSIDYLVGRSDEMGLINVQSNVELSDQEMNFVEIMRKLSAQQQLQVVMFASRYL